jgi:protein TonB
MSEQHPGGRPNSRFLAGRIPGEAAPAARIRGAFSVSMLAHAVGLGVILLIMSRPGPQQGVLVQVQPASIVWIAQPGRGSGGGGGGNRRPEPPQAAQAPGHDTVTVPVITAPPDRPTAADVPPPIQQLAIPAIATTAGLVEIPGTLTPVGTPVADSRGSGTGPGSGTGDGPGDGPGRGRGLGDGLEQGTGGGDYRPGADVSMPRVIYEEKPNYTADAMRAKVQGAVTLEAVVMPDGSVGVVQVTHSLDPVFGLDQEAMRTVRQWRFAPARHKGRPVPMRVAIEMTFTLR